MKWLGRSVLVLAVLVALAIGASALWQRQIGEMIFRKAVHAAVRADISSTLPDGLHVFVCGSGSPMPDPARAGPCLGVLAGKHAFLIDIGSGGARRLGRMGFPIGQIERVYLTHLHSDHFDGLGELLVQAWVTGPRHTPLPIAGPPGVEEVVAGLRQAYRIDSGYRTIHHGPKVADPAGFGGQAEVIAAPEAAIPQRVIYESDNTRVTVILVEHAPATPAYAYRIDYKDRSLVISGDTRKCEALARASRDADILFHEALNVGMVREMGRAAQAGGQKSAVKILADIPVYHTTPEQAAQTASLAHVRQLVLYHVIPPLPARYFSAAFLGDAHRYYSGRITVARDGLLVSAPAGETGVSFRMIS